MLKKHALSHLNFKAFPFVLMALLPFTASLAQDDMFYLSYTTGAPGNISEHAIKGDIGTGSAQPGGSYQYSFPLDVPAGPRGIAPSLAITYTGEGFGWVGRNWNFSFGSVSWDTREGVPQNFTYGTNKRFLLNGSLLKWDAAKSRYRTEIENHQHITYANGYWTAKSPDGTQYLYDVAVTAKSFDDSNLGTREWLLGQVIDVHGNSITYNYAQMAGNSTTLYPANVVWGKTGAYFHCAKFNVVPFDSTYATRISYATGSKVIENQKLSSIDVMFNTNDECSGGSLIRRYTLNYNNAGISKAPRLTEIVETGLGVSSPDRKTQFAYNPNESTDLNQQNSFLNGLPKLVSGALYTLRETLTCTNEGPPCEFVIGGPPVRSRSYGEYKSNTDIVDIDNDGIPEYIQASGGPLGGGSRPDQITNQNYAYDKVWKLDSLDGGWSVDSSLRIPAPLRNLFSTSTNGTQDYGARFIDLDRDGAQDLLVSYEYRPENNNNSPFQGEFAWFNNGNPKGVNWGSKTAFPFPTVSGNKLRLAYYKQDSGVRLADVNGDGYPDLIHAYQPEAEAVSGYPNARDMNEPGYTCYNETTTTLAPPSGQGVYLMNPSTKRWDLPKSTTFVLPAEVFFVGNVPVDGSRWRCPDSETVGGCGDNRGGLDATIQADLGTQLLDVNGDGLPDIVKATQYSYNCAGPSCPTSSGENCNSTWSGQGNGVYLNTGRGWAYSDSWTTSLQNRGVILHNQDLLCRFNCQSSYALLDFNDDGLPDIQNMNSGHTFQNNGAGWNATSTNNNAFIQFGRGQQFQDFTGDGRPDYLQVYMKERMDNTDPQNTDGILTTGQFMSESLFYKSSSTHPDLLDTVTNWMGGKLKIVYGHSSQWRDYHNAKLPQTRYVVTQVESDASPGNSDLKARDPIDPNSLSGTPGTTKTTYEYRNGEFDFQDREFRGFGKVISIANPDSSSSGTKVYTETLYHQDDIYKGLVEQVTVKTGAAGTTLQFKDFTYTSISPMTGVYDRRMTTEVEKSTPAGNILKQVDYVYDQTGTYGTGEAYGNLLSKTETGSVFAAPSTYIKTTWDYKPNTSAWILGAPKTQKIFSGSSSTPSQETTYFYDGQTDANQPPIKGLLTKTSTKTVYNGVTEQDTVTEAAYDSFGNKTSSKDANGKTTSFFYTNGTYLNRISNAINQNVWMYYHGVNATPSSPCDVAQIPGALQKFTIDNATANNTSAPTTTCYSYDTLGRLLNVYAPSDPNIPQVSYNYLNFGTPGTQRAEILNRDPTGTVYTRHFLDGFGRIVQTRAEGLSGQNIVTTRQFDLSGRLWRSTTPIITSDSTSYVAPASGVTKWASTAYDILSRPLTEKDIDGTTTTFSYNNLDVTTTNKRNIQKKLFYDSLARLYKVQDFTASGTLDGTTTYSYNALGNLTGLTDAENNSASYSYDSLGRRREMDHPDRGEWHYKYDGNGNLIEQTDAKNVKLLFDYDELGRLIQKHSPTAGLLANFYYDNKLPQLGQANLTDLVAWHDWGPAVNGPWPSWYNNYTLNNMTASPSASSLESCPSCGNYASFITHEIKTTAPVKDFQLNLTFLDATNLNFFVEFRNPDNSLVPGITTGNLATGTGQIVTRTVKVPRQTYSSFTKIIVKVYYGQLSLYHTTLTPVDDANVTYTNGTESAGRSFTAEYGWGKLSSFADLTGQTAFKYDAKGRLIAERKVIDGLGYVTDNTYTLDDLIKTVTYPNGEILTYTYDDARRLTSLASSLDGSVKLLSGVTYNSNNLLSHVDFEVDGSNKVYYTDYAYQASDLRLDTLTTFKVQPSTLLQSLAFDYDPAGNIAKVTDGTSAAGTTEGRARLGTASTPIAYDHLDRLTSVILPNTSGVDTTYAYAYSKTGNFQSFEGKTYKYGSACPAGFVGAPHQLCEVMLSSTTSQRFEYDENGNVITADFWAKPGATWVWSYDGPVFTYNIENKVSHVDIPISVYEMDTLDMSYDANGTRVKRSANRGGLQYDTVYVGPHYEKRYGQNQEGSTSLYHAFGRLVAERSHAVSGEGTSQVRYFFADHLGSSSTVWNDAGSAIWTQTYRPFGGDHWSPSTLTEPDNDSYKYTGQEQDYSFLYDYNARSYLPGLGTFAQADTWEGELGNPQTQNPYFYTLGNPFKYTDPTGHRADPPVSGMTLDEFLNGSPFVYTAPRDSESVYAYIAITVTGSPLEGQLVVVDPQLRTVFEGMRNVTAELKKMLATSTDFALNHGITVLALAFPASKAINTQAALGELMRGNFAGAALTYFLGPNAKSLYAPMSRGTEIISRISTALNSAKIWAGHFPLIGGPKGGMLARKTASGSTTHYAVYDASGNILKRVDLVGKSHAGVPTPHVLDYIHDVNKTTGEIFPRAPKVPRAATQDEIP